MTVLFSTAALAVAEGVVNKALDYDPASRQALSKLSGRVMKISLAKPAMDIYLAPDAQGLRLLGYWEGEPEVQLRGSLPALMELARNPQNNLKDSDVEVDGDTDLLMAMRDIMQSLDIDWEEALSQLLGDVAGHGGAQRLRDAGTWLQGRADTSRRLLGEFITEELRLLPARNELESFYRAVDQLRLDVDRAEARLRQLKPQQLSGVAHSAEHKD